MDFSQQANFLCSVCSCFFQQSEAQGEATQLCPACREKLRKLETKVEQMKSIQPEGKEGGISQVAVSDDSASLSSVDQRMRLTQLRISTLTSVRDKEFFIRAQLQTEVSNLKRDLCRHFQLAVKQQIDILEVRLMTQSKEVTGVQEQLYNTYVEMNELRKEKEALNKLKGKKVDRWVPLKSPPFQQIATDVPILTTLQQGKRLSRSPIAERK